MFAQTRLAWRAIRPITAKTPLARVDPERGSWTDRIACRSASQPTKPYPIVDPRLARKLEYVEYSRHETASSSDIARYSCRTWSVWSRTSSDRTRYAVSVYQDGSGRPYGRSHLARWKLVTVIGQGDAFLGVGHAMTTHKIVLTLGSPLA